ncbi:hypothetical protein F5884DRAFT_802720 [Xylogone sp. PMI_703]|nr:hypothetical protein F5884DRAFT_802720 [Xylogone sp. PMI_703]
MAHDDILTDEYVAGLLAKDAKESSIKYSAMGLEGFASSKPPANKLKPNTRFLRSIIQETDSHNAALLAKEAAESRARLASLPRQASRNSRPPKVSDSDIRRRQMGDIATILAGGANKRRKTETPDSRDTNSIRANTSSDDERSTKQEDREKKRVHGSKDEEKYSDRSRHRSSRKHPRSDSRDSSKDRRRHRDRRERSSRSRSPREDGKKESRHRHRSRRRSRSREREYSGSSSRDYKSFKHRRSGSQDRSSSRDKSSRPHRRHRSPDDRKTSGMKIRKDKPSKQDEDSDPLDDIIGPKPPPVQKVHRKGRGITSLESGIDARFSSNYDPTVDVQLNHDEEDDWDQALEALRDRQKWKQQGAERLRSAGFTEDEIRKWEKGGEKNEEDVRWTKRGEAREWDRGKVFDDDGQVTLEADFGRLKGT